MVAVHNQAGVSSSAASCSQMKFGWRGSIWAQPLPRCVESVAPAPIASLICCGVAAVCPMATSTPSRTSRSISGTHRRNFWSDGHDFDAPAAESWRRAKSSSDAGCTSARLCAPRGPSSGEMYGPSM